MSPRVVSLGLIAFAFNVAGGLIAPALPLYARSLGATYWDLGVIGASHGFAFAALAIPLGRASDRFGRRRFLLASTLAEGISSACYCFSVRVRGLVVAKLLQAAASAAFWPALEAWVAEEFGPRAGAAMGIGYAAFAASFLVGTSAAGFVIEAAGLRAPFAIAIGTAAATACLVLSLPGGRAVPRTQRHEAAERPAARPPDDGAPRRQRLLAYGTGFVYVFGLGTVLAFLPAYAADRGVPPGGVGLLLGTYYGGRLLASLAAGPMSDRLGRRAVLVPAMLASVAGAIIVAVPTGVGLLFVGTAGLGLTAGACAPTCIGHIADHVAATHRGMAMGMFESACGLAFILAGLAGGYTAGAFGDSMPYLLVAGLSLAWMLVLSRGLPRPSGRRPG
ncbi:MAG: MFS transporter [Candidatus Rokubacteria bacterium]|nr:MFS transporter [Candidatus Rokubacteria bacterium]